MPEVGIAGLPLDFPHSGTAVYLRNLYPRLGEAAPDLAFRLFVRNAERLESVRADPWRNAVSNIASPVPKGLNRGRPAVARMDKLLWETLSLPLASARHKEDLLHVPYFAAPILTGRRLVVTVHDLIPLVLPGYHRGRASRMYSDLMAWAVPRADAIITVSEHSKRDIMRVLGMPEEKVTVIAEAADQMARAPGTGNGRALQERYGISVPYVLYIGGAERRKNIETLVRAWGRIAPWARTRGIRLVIVARFPAPDPLYPDIPTLVRELDLSREVVILPQVDEQDKSLVYRGALAMCFPSIYEGFGLTPLEAMAAGTPVIAADATSIPEVVGDAGVLLPPTDADAWADAITSVADSDAERQRLINAGRRRAAAFSWRRAAEETIGVYRNVLSE